MSDAVMAAAFVHFATEHHKLTGEWPTGDVATSIVQEAAGLAECFESGLDPDAEADE